MNDARDDIERWMRAGVLPASRAGEAQAVLETLPSPVAWRRFLERALALLAAVALAASLAFFIAANWSVLGRFGKFALIEAAIVVAVAIACWRGLDSTFGRAGLFAACLATGTLLAFVGQTYQTGADTWELFATWAVAILAWIAVSRQPAAWLLWLAIVDLGVWLYLAESVATFGLAFGERAAMWATLGIHALAAIAWELARRRVAWLDVDWAPRVIVVVGLGLVTLLAMDAILANRREAPGWLALGVYGAALAVVYFAYRLLRTDLLLLSAAALSAIAIVVAAIARADPFDSVFGWLVIGLVIIGLSTLAANWLRSIAREGQMKAIGGGR